MTFVYPLLLGGLVLAGLPVLLHFLVRQQPKTLPFPAFRFLIQKRRSNTRNLRLRHLLLLLLRMALLALVCLALARPRLLHDSVGLSREKPVALVMIFDTSPSMEYKSNEQTRLDLAKRRGLELLDQMPEDCRVLVLDTSGDIGRDEWYKSLDKARNRIQSMTIQPSSVPVTKALDEAQRRFEAWDKGGDDPEGRNLPRFVCVFSDRTKASWDSSAFTKRPTPDDAVKVQTLYFDVGIDDPVDVAITQAELPADRHSFTAGEKVPLRGVVQATGKPATNTLAVHLGKERASQTFSAEPGKPLALTLEFDTTDLAPGLHQAEIKLASADDALPFNNVRHLTFAIHEKQKVLVLADDLQKTRRFADALAALLYTVDHKNVKDVPPLASYQAIFLVSVAAPTDTLWEKLADYVKQGGGLGIIPPGDEMQPDRYHSEAARKVMPAEFVKKIDSPTRTGATWNLVQSEIRHSFLSVYVKGVAEGWDFGVNPPRASHYWLVKAAENDVIVRYDESDNAAVALHTSTGKVLLLTTPMDDRTPTWNNYGESGTSFHLILPLMCARQLCPEPAASALNFQFGREPALVQKPAHLRFPKYLVSSGDFAEEIRFDEKDRWVADRLPKAGSYTVSGTNPGQETKAIAKFSVNVPGEESDLTRVPIKEIEAALGKDAVVAQDRRTSLRDSLKWDEPIELFPWLMIGLLFLLAVENLLANRSYRQEPAQ